MTATWDHPVRPRRDQSLVSQWWRTIDRWQLAALAILIVAGCLLITASSPAVASRIGIANEFHFVIRHLAFTALAVMVIVIVSMLDPVRIRRLGWLMLAGAVLGILATLVIGAEIKGATRWLHLPGMSMQPSEFAKPAFAVAAAWLFSRAVLVPGFPGRALSIGLWALLVALLMLQPDLGMAVLITAVWGTQFFLAGLPLWLVVGAGLMAMAAMLGAYLALPHVASRIDRFLNPEGADTYQVDKSLEAFSNGGLWGTGPGDGTVKHQIPDVHADFIFAVAGEEYGLILSLVLVVVFAGFVLRGLGRAFAQNDLFVLLAASGLAVQIGLQSLINLGSTLHLIPTKGMTLPFVSYGGSSLLALAATTGMLLALTRQAPRAKGPIQAVYAAGTPRGLP